jgi:hypothetical protein
MVGRTPPRTISARPLRTSGLRTRASNDGSGIDSSDRASRRKRSVCFSLRVCSALAAGGAAAGAKPGSGVASIDDGGSAIRGSVGRIWRLVALRLARKSSSWAAKLSRAALGREICSGVEVGSTQSNERKAANGRSPKVMEIRLRPGHAASRVRWFECLIRPNRFRVPYWCSSPGNKLVRRGGHALVGQGYCGSLRQASHPCPFR